MNKGYQAVKTSGLCYGQDLKKNVVYYYQESTKFQERVVCITRRIFHAK